MRTTLLCRRWAMALCSALALLAAQGPAAADTAAHQAALQACPTVKHEIVNLDMLAEGLKDSDAVGMLQKLKLKSAIDQLVERLKAYHGGARRYTLEQLQEQYDLLMMRIARQLQDKDPPLLGRLCNAWEPLWSQLQDRRQFLEMIS